ncbi:MAG TPA: matrixin family metalloprotease [Gemmatimonadales bacterium]
MDDRRLSQLVAAVIVLVVLGVMWDVSRRTIRRSRQRGPEATVESVVVVMDSATRDAPPPGAGGQTQGLQSPPDGPSYMESVARSETRRQIRASSGITYLNEILAASGDSMLHRWDNRAHRPVRVYFASTRALNYRPAFQEAVRAALRDWESVVPVSFEPVTDSASAEVRFFWRVQFEIDRTGQTDLEWDHNGHIMSGMVTLSTFDAKGQPMGPEEIRLVALHEIGHVVGLDHSPDATDVMYPVATVRQLSLRDVETARLLYRLAPGSVR